MVARAERTSDRRSTRDEAEPKENGSSDNKACLDAEGTNENKTTTGGCWVRVGPAGEAVKGAEKEGANAECDDRRYRFQICIRMNVDWLAG